jgi:hypothetical protein
MNKYIKDNFIKLKQFIIYLRKMLLRQIKSYTKFIHKNFTTKESILPDHLTYNIPKYDKNPEHFDFPWLIGGAPLLELKVYISLKAGQISSRTSVPKIKNFKATSPEAFI